MLIHVLVSRQPFFDLIRCLLTTRRINHPIRFLRDSAIVENESTFQTRATVFHGFSQFFTRFITDGVAILLDLAVAAYESKKL